MNAKVDAPAYEKIKTFLLEEIGAGKLRAGDRVPSENELARLFGVVRMTANRAVVDLVHEGVLHRVKGSGTYVSPARYGSTLVEIRDIRSEVIARGHAYRAELLGSEQVALNPFQAEELGMKPSEHAYYTEMLHLEDGVPIQLERRLVNPAAAPEYLAQDFAAITPTNYLLQVAPLQRAEYRIRAEAPTRQIARTLRLEPHEPVLVLWRRTFSPSLTVTVAELYHPAGRFEFTGTF